MLSTVCSNKTYFGLTYRQKDTLSAIFTQLIAEYLILNLLLSALNLIITVLNVLIRCTPQKQHVNIVNFQYLLKIE